MGVADVCEKFADFRLVNDNQRDQTHTENLAQYVGKHRQMEVAGNGPDDENNEDTEENFHGAGTPQETVQPVHQNGDQQDIHRVGNAEFQEA